MRAYIIKRLVLIIPTVFLVSIVIFLIARLIPGDIVDMMSVESLVVTEESRAAMEQALGLDVPVLTQYGRWVGVLPSGDDGFSGILQGDLGDSLWRGIPVTRLIGPRWKVTFELGALGLLWLIIISVPIGIYSAIRQDSWGDYIARSFATGLITLPNFWVGIIVIYIGSVWFGVSPELKAISFTKDPIANLRQFIVPAFIVGMAGTGGIMRLTRSMMLEVLRQDYIRTAWAKGLRERVVILRHALKNAIIPVFTSLAGALPILVGGTVVIEIVFGLPGMGHLLVDSLSLRDFTLVYGIVFIFAICMVFINLIADLIYAYLDPRIRYK